MLRSRFTLGVPHREERDRMVGKGAGQEVPYFAKRMGLQLCFAFLRNCHSSFGGQHGFRFRQENLYVTFLAGSDNFRPFRIVAVVFCMHVKCANRGRKVASIRLENGVNPHPSLSIVTRGGESLVLFGFW